MFLAQIILHYVLFTCTDSVFALQLFKKPCEENKLLDKKESHTMFSNIQE